MSVSNPFRAILDVLPNDERTSIEKREIGEVIHNEGINLIERTPIVGSTLSELNSFMQRGTALFQQLTKNPVGMAQGLLNGLFRRKIINTYFEGLTGLLKDGKFLSKSQSAWSVEPYTGSQERDVISRGVEGQWLDNKQIVNKSSKKAGVPDSEQKKMGILYKDKPNTGKAVDDIISGGELDSSSSNAGVSNEEKKKMGKLPSGQVNTGDKTARVIAKPSKEVEESSKNAGVAKSELDKMGELHENTHFKEATISIDEFPAYASIDGFFQTTIGTDFYWGIKMSKIDNLTDSKIPNPPFFEQGKINGKRDPEKTGFGGWLPAFSYTLDWLTTNTENLDEEAFALSMISGYKLENSLKIELFDTEAREYLKWLQEYGRVVHPKPKVVLPYKNTVYKLEIWTFYPSGKKMQYLPLMVIPKASWGLEGANDKSTGVNVTMDLSIVGIMFDDVSNASEFKLIENK